MPIQVQEKRLIEHLAKVLLSYIDLRLKIYGLTVSISIALSN